MRRRNLLKMMGLGAGAAVIASQNSDARTAARPSASPWPSPVPGSGKADGLLGHCRVGKGPATCIVLHEWLGDHVNWEQTLAYFDLDKLSLVFADLRGYGWSRAMSGRFTMEEATADVLRLADHLKLPRFHLVAHSMSGLIGQNIATQAAARIQSLTLFSPVPPTGFKADEATMKALAAVITDDEAASRAINARVSNRYGSGWLKRKLDIARHAATLDAMRGYLTMFTSSSITQPNRLTAPLHVVSGAQDIPFYRNDAFRAAFSAAYANPGFEQIEDGGHYTMLETPVRVAAIVEKQVLAAG